ncbi:MAG: ABC transporter permease [Bacteroidales bacterium]|nr:ABC transporter permease [Bacteroidales bacterium]
MNRYLTEISAITFLILKGLIRTRRSIIFWVIFPSLMLLLFGLIYAGADNAAKSFDYTAPGILIGAALFFSCLGGTTAHVVAERERRTLRRLLLSPLKPVSYFLGIVSAQLVIAFGQTIIVYGIAFLFGGRIYGSIFLCLAIIVLSVFSFVGMGFFFGARFAKRTEDVNGPVAAFGVPLLVLGGTFFPISIMPPYLLKVAYLNPIFHMNQALKGVSAAGYGVDDIWTNMLFLIIFTLLTLLLGVHSYRKLLSKEKMT